MRALHITRITTLAEDPEPLKIAEVPVPEPGEAEVLIRVIACGVCHTELDEIEGRTEPNHLPMIPGHQVIGEVVGLGRGARNDLAGRRVGVAWIHRACGHCGHCRDGRENLCAEFCATGRDTAGGYAEYMTAPEAFVHPIPDALGATAAAPLLCAGAVGYRALRLCKLKDGEPLGLTGFGASAHLVLQMAKHLYPSSPVIVFARSSGERRFARELGAEWAGETAESPPQPPAAIIDTTPAWLPVVSALEHLAPGGRLVINAIRKEDGDRAALESLDYDRHLWREKSVQSVANVTRKDVRRCLALAAQEAIHCTVETYTLDQANRALSRIRAGGLRGALVLQVASNG